MGGCGLVVSHSPDQPIFSMEQPIGRNLTLPPERGCPQPQHVEKANAAAAQESRAPSAWPWFGGGVKLRPQPILKQHRGVNNSIGIEA
jgi:hypothetical protein